ncbi:MAG: GNAT family N-acetyltransferase [bacterium]|jgi:RimJ/RimL family protein N-acetyltransferase
MENTNFLYDDVAALVPLTAEHVPDMVKWVNDPAVIHFLMIPGNLTTDQEMQWLERVRNDQSQIVMGIVEREGGKYVGNIGLHNISRRNSHAEYGIFIGEREFWGRGIGTSAGRLIIDHGFNTLNLNRIFLRVYAFNERGIACYKKLGFTEEGRLRGHVFKDGRYHDEVMMGVLRDEWNERWKEWRARQRKRYGIE